MEANELFKIRSVTSCMKEAYRMETKELKALIKKTWWAMLACAFLCALTLYFRTPNKALHDWGEGSPTVAFITQTAIYGLCFLSTFLPGTAVWKWITGKKWGSTLATYSVLRLLNILVAMVFAVLFTYVFRATVTGWALGTACALVGFVLCLPFAYVIPHFLLHDRKERKTLWKAWSCGLMNLGRLFLLGFLSYLILFVLECIVAIPGIILMGAQLLSQIGALEGDPTGVPGYFTPLFIGVLTILFFVTLYLTTWIDLAYMFLNTSITTEEKDKANNTYTLLNNEKD